MSRTHAQRRPFAAERALAPERLPVPVVAVVIPSYNSSKHVRGCLQALRLQETEVPYEIVLVDSSDDGTDRIVAEEFPEARLFHCPERCSTGKAREIGVNKARADVVLFLDIDCVPQRQWIDHMYGAIRRYGANAVCGSVANGTPSSIMGSVGYYLEFFRFLPHRGRHHELPFIVGANSGFRKEVLTTIRFVDLSIADDVSLSVQLKQQGQQLLFLPRVSVKHMNKTGLATVFQYQYQLGVAASEYRRGLSPKIMYPLLRVPLLTFLLPNAVMVWIGSVVLRRCGFLELLKFLVLLPVTYAANMAWAAGFYRGLRTEPVPGDRIGPQDRE